MNGFRGEALYFKARTGLSDGTEALWLFDKAAAVFPPEYRIREGEAVFKSIYEGIPPEVAIDQIQAELRRDPWSPNLWFFLGIQRARQGDLAGVMRARAMVESVAPMWANVEALKKAELELQAALPDRATDREEPDHHSK